MKNAAILLALVVVCVGCASAPEVVTPLEQIDELRATENTPAPTEETLECFNPLDVTPPESISDVPFLSFFWKSGMDAEFAGSLGYIFFADGKPWLSVDVRSINELPIQQMPPWCINAVKRTAERVRRGLLPESEDGLLRRWLAGDYSAVMELDCRGYFAAINLLRIVETRHEISQREEQEEETPPKPEPEMEKTRISRMWMW